MIHFLYAVTTVQIFFFFLSHMLWKPYACLYVLGEHMHTKFKRVSQHLSELNQGQVQSNSLLQLWVCAH